ncbi:MAG: anhydro-N-acetylmuramic acid kinase [Bacteroidia bacterium]|nr:anhydro-N-acetylmuramic acid kinase [Bacteroidia bacterium]
MHTPENIARVNAVGLMSGTSMDGVDLAACSFELRDNTWSYTLHHATTVPYPAAWLEKIRSLPGLHAAEVFEADAALGRYFGGLVLDFVKTHGFRADLVASHGHTLFHKPSRGYTTQIGSGAHLAAVCGVRTICDFRSKDVALGGQGAPLVPVGDHLLFPEYEACLNLGGIANISLLSAGKRIAFDICPVNMALNMLAERENLRYDDQGKMARQGKLLPGLLEQLNGLSFYQQQGPKSLGREWYEQEFAPLLGQGSAADLSRTVCEHIAEQHLRVFGQLKPQSKILVTGGGAFHTFLLERMAEKSQKVLTVPAEDLVKFKEALVFAFLGVLNYSGRVNVFDSATGSVKQHVGGAMYWGDVL